MAEGISHMPANDFSGKRWRNEMFEHIPGEDHHELNPVKGNGGKAFGMKPGGGDGAFAEGLKRVRGYVSQGIGAGREGFDCVIPEVPGQSLGHSASARIAYADKEDTLFHFAKFLSRLWNVMQNSVNSVPNLTRRPPEKSFGGQKLDGRGTSIWFVWGAEAPAKNTQVLSWCSATE